MYQLFVRWKAMSGGRCHVVSLEFNGKEVLAYQTDNTDRIYGYCSGVVDALNLIRPTIKMPKCLTGRHMTPDMTRQD